MRFLPALLLLFTLPAHAGTVYLNQQISSGCDDYNPSTGVCGGGSASARTTFAGIESWLSSDGAGSSTVRVVGGNSLLNRKDITLDRTRTWSLDLSGNQCDGLIIEADPNFPHHVITARVQNLTNWTKAYKASDDYGLLVGDVYTHPIPNGFKTGSDEDQLTEDTPGPGNTNVDRMISLYESGQLEEWDPLTGTQWTMKLGRNADTHQPNNGRLSADTVYRSGDWYTKNGLIYYYALDGQHPNTSWKGATREIVWTRSLDGFLRVNSSCSDITLQNLYIDHVDMIFSASGVEPIYFYNNVFGTSPKRMQGGGYYTIGITNSSGNAKVDHAAFVDNYFVLTNAAFSNHRANAMRLQHAEGFLFDNNKFLGAGGHGHIALEGTDYGVIVGNEFWLAGGKDLNYLGSSHSYVVGNTFSMMVDSMCTWPSVPEGFPGLQAGKCVPWGSSVGIRQTETHVNSSLVASNHLYMLNKHYGAGGGTYWSARKSWGRGPNNEYSRSINNTFYKSVIRPPIKDLDNKFSAKPGSSTPGQRLHDGPESYKGPVYRFRGINDNYQHLIARGFSGEPDSQLSLKVEYADWSADQSLAGRDVTFENNLFSAYEVNGVEQKVVKYRSAYLTCNDWDSGQANVTGTVCTDVLQPVVKAVPTSRVGADLRPTSASYPSVDAGKTAAQATNSDSGTSLPVSDIHSFPPIRSLGTDAIHKQRVADALNKHFCGEANCANPSNPGEVPDAYWPSGGLKAGELFVQVDGTPTAYTGYSVGSGKNGTLTLASSQTWTPSTGVHPLPWSGSAPDIGLELFAGAPPDSLSARDGTYTLEELQLHSLNLCTLGFGSGNGASGFEIKGPSLQEDSPFIVGLSKNGADPCLADVTLSSGPGVGQFTYQLEKPANSLESNTATVTINLTGVSSQQVVFFYDTPINVMGAVDTWTTTNLTGAGSPSDAVAVFGYHYNDSSAGAAMQGARPAGDASTPIGNYGSNSGGMTLSRTGAGGELDTYVSANMLEFNAHGYFANASGVTDEGAAPVPVTCDSTWRTISEVGKSLVIYTLDVEGLIAIAMNPGSGIAPNEKQINVSQLVSGVPDSNGDVHYRCSGTTTALLRHLSVAEGAGIAKPDSGDYQLFTPAVANTKETVSPTGFTCLGGNCLGYLVYILDPNRSTTRYKVASTVDELSSANDQGALHARWEIVKAAPDGSFAIVSNQSSTNFLVVAAITEGTTDTVDPTILEISTCPASDPLHGRQPDISLHSGAIQATAGVVCASNDISIPANNSMAVQTGTSNFQLDFMVKSVGGRMVLEFHDDGGVWTDYQTLAPDSNRAGMSAILNWANDTFSLLSYGESGQTQQAGPATIPGYIPAGTDAYVRVVSRPTSPWTQQTMDLYVKATPITSEDSPLLSAVYANAATRVDTGIIEFWQKNTTSTVGISTQPITATSPSQIDALPPQTATVTPSVSGQQITLTWTPPSDSGGAVASYVKWVEVLRGTSPTPTTVLKRRLHANTSSFIDNVPDTQTYYYRVRWVDASGNYFESDDVVVSSVTPNAPPTVTSPGSAEVRAGVELLSPTQYLDAGSICTATDPDGDAMTVGVVTQPAAGEATAVEPNSTLLTYVHQRAQLTPDTLVVNFTDTQGNTSPDCTINLTVLGPPYIEVPVAMRTRDAVGTDLAVLVTLYPFGTEFPAPVENGEPVVLPTVTSNVTLEVADCPSWTNQPDGSPHPYNCGKFRVYLEPFDARYVAVGDDVPASGWEVDPAGESELPQVTFSFKGVIKE